MAVVKAGYKKTDVGVIPEDWDVKSLGQLLEVTSSKRIFQNDWRKQGIPFYRARELVVLGDAGLVSNDLFIERALYEKYKRSYGVPKKGDILVTGVGTLGKVYVVPDKKEFYFKDGNIIWFKVKKINSNYLKQLYLTPLIEKQISEFSAGSTVGTYTISGAKRTRIPYPSLLEQKVIAQVLSGVDSLVESLQKLIHKKRDIKTAVMQQLLTGKKRLQGFNNKWVVRKLEDLFCITTGADLNRDDFSESCSGKYGYPIYANAVTKRGLYGYASSWHSENCITITARGTLGVSFYRSHKFTAIGRLIILTPKTELNGILISQMINETLYFANESTGVPQLTGPQVSKYEILIPTDIEEQTAIASIISDMDNEIESLEQRLKKTKALKLGMMQELLTGNIRLLSPEALKEVVT